MCVYMCPTHQLTEMCAAPPKISSATIYTLSNTPLLSVPFSLSFYKINMHFSLLFTVVVCCLISLMAVQGYIPESGTFMTRDGSECTWFDLRENHSNKLSLATACMCKDREGKAQSYGCQYTTEHMDWCDKLKTEQSREVLLGLVHQLEGIFKSTYLYITLYSLCTAQYINLSSIYFLIHTHIFRSQQFLSITPIGSH